MAVEFLAKYAMDEHDQHPDEGIISYALRMKQLPRDHPARPTTEILDAMVWAGIAQMKRRSEANIALLKKHGLEHTIWRG